MDTKKMFDKEALDNLLGRILKELEESRQFDRLEKERDAIYIRTEDPKVFVRIPLLQTYSDKGVYVRASGLRITFEHSLCDQLKIYMVPKWSQLEEKWHFSRSKLLAKAAFAIELIQEWQDRRDKETQRRKVFARFIGDELGYLQERGEVKLVHDYDRRGRSIKKIVRIELPHIYIDLFSPDNGQTFRIERIKPMADKIVAQYFDIEEIKEIITKLEKIFVPEEALVP